MPVITVTELPHAQPSEAPAGGELALVQAAREGSRPAFAELVRRHERLVRGFVWQTVHGKHEADDLSQEVFVAAWENLADYRGDGPLGAWLLGIARRKVLTFLRDRARRQRREEALLETLLAHWQAEQIAAVELNEDREREQLARLEACLGGLPPHRRAIVDRYYFQEHSADEIGRAIGKGAGAVRMLLLRIRDALKRCLLRKERENQP